jgi:hypothetical protein
MIELLARSVGYSGVATTNATLRAPPASVAATRYDGSRADPRCEGSGANNILGHLARDALDGGNALFAARPVE